MNVSVLTNNTMPETQAQRPTRRKLVYEDYSEVYGQTAEVSKERCVYSDKARRKYHIQSRIRNLGSGSRHQSSQYEEASQALEMREYTLAARIYQEILSCCEVDSAAKNGFQDSVVVQICLNLTECYLHLQSPKEAESVLFQLWHPEGKYTIGATHPLFLETARLYSRMQKQLKGATEKNGEETGNQEEEQLVKELELFYMYGYQYFKTGFPEKAGGIYRHGLRHLEESIEVLGEKLKEVVVRIRLALSETYIAIKQMEEAAKLLEEVWVPGRTLSIDHHHQHFLWLSKLHAHLQRSRPHYSGVPEPTTSCAPLYQRLGVHHAATAQDIRKAYLRLARFFHPDKGVDTGVMQQVRAGQARLIRVSFPTTD